MSDLPNIPSCRSEFLQNFAIRLRPHLTVHGWRSFDADADFCEQEDERLERLRIRITTYYFTQTRFHLWEDKAIWVNVTIFPTKPDNFEIGFYPDFALLGTERLVEALIETVSVSTRLCYDESPEHLLREIWNFSGEVQIEGVL